VNHYLGSYEPELLYVGLAAAEKMVHYLTLNSLPQKVYFQILGTKLHNYIYVAVTC
jgi:hypothetical protein